MWDERQGVIFIDTDLNPDTPAGGLTQGADCVVRFLGTGNYGSGSVELVGDSYFDLGARGTTVQSQPDSLTVSLPLSLWGGSAAVRLFAVSASWPTEAGRDRVPDAGFLDVATGLAVVPRPGNQSVHVVLSDPVGDMAVPDLTRVEVAVTNGYFLLWLTFAHSMDEDHFKSYFDEMEINVQMDLDYRLATGFRNMLGSPPTGGVDAEINLSLGALYSTATLSRHEARDPTAMETLSPKLTEIALGELESDSHWSVGRNDTLGVVFNQVFVSFPLSYLRYNNGEMLLAASAWLLMSPGALDFLPDAGLIDTRVGLTPEQRVRLPASCAATDFVGWDNPDDASFEGLPYFRGEIISSHSCPMDDGTLRITVDVERLDASIEGNDIPMAVAVLLDTVKPACLSAMELKPRLGWIWNSWATSSPWRTRTYSG
jgi:hypothetical protein